MHKKHGCESLSERFDKMKAEGLVDVKFYLRNLDEAAVEAVCAEVSALYEAVERGETSKLDFKDTYN